VDQQEIVVLLLVKAQGHLANPKLNGGRRLSVHGTRLGRVYSSHSSQIKRIHATDELLDQHGKRLELLPL
jgi:hypothetical protein